MFDDFLLAGNRDFRGRLTDSQLDRQVQPGADLQGDVRTLQALETGGRHFNVVNAGNQIWNCVEPIGRGFVSLTVLVAVLVAFTVAFGTVAPLGSVTVPVSVARSCAKRPNALTEAQQGYFSSSYVSLFHFLNSHPS